MKKVLDFIEKITKEYKYKRLPEDKSKLARDWYTKNIPSFLDVNGSNTTLYSLDGTVLCHEYKRIVVGDYGAFIEFDISQSINFKVTPGQEYRTLKEFKNNVKYLWYTCKDNSNCKIYQQIRTVSYADYLPGMCYISPYEVKI